MNRNRLEINVAMQQPLIARPSLNTKIQQVKIWTKTEATQKTLGIKVYSKTVRKSLLTSHNAVKISPGIM